MILDPNHTNARGGLLEINDYGDEAEADRHIDRLRALDWTWKRLSVKKLKRRIRVDGLVVVKWFVVVREKQ